MIKEKSDMTKMEFLLTLNDNIIVQRYYNVKGYNKDAKNSVELYDAVDEIRNQIHQDLKMKTITYMLDNQFQIMTDQNIMETSMTEDEERFNVYIKLNDDVIYHMIWDGKIYPPKVRYTVDVRPHLKSVLKSLTEVFSTDKLTHEFNGYNLI
jgi:hypothetical protein|tara:strand:+ start:16296 stop:16751 length:456 start_codon:yes stop_codon:yes gene_type:complete